MRIRLPTLTRSWMAVGSPWASRAGLEPEELAVDRFGDDLVNSQMPMTSRKLASASARKISVRFGSGAANWVSVRLLELSTSWCLWTTTRCSIGSGLVSWGVWGDRWLLETCWRGGSWAGMSRLSEPEADWAELPESTLETSLAVFLAE